MKWKGLCAVLIIVALLGGFIGVPAVQAHTVYTVLGAPVANSLDSRISNVSPASAGYSTVSITGYQIFDGVRYDSSGGSQGQTASTTSTNMSMFFWCPAVLVTDGEHSFEFAVSVTWTSTIQNWSWSGTVVTSGGKILSAALIVPLSVAITGSATASIGVNTSFVAVITNGTAPYSTTWHVDGTGGNEGVILDASNVSATGLTVKFATISHYIVRATVVDAVGGMASATYDVNLSSAKPVMHGQIIRAEAAESYTFNMYTDGVVLTDGVALASECIPSAEYEVTSPTVIMQSEYGWQIWPVSPLPNPLYVYVTYHAAETGFVWSYRFTMDTSILTGAGTWTKSDGTGSDDGATLAPTWVDGLLNRLKIVLIDSSKAAFRWLFVPDAAQMALLMPQGTVQADGTLSKEGNIAASLLEGTTWGAGASEWKLTVHYATFSITLVDIDFTAMRSSAFVRGIRFAIQAVMSMSLVYLVVVLI